jgi:hypothetical protein
LAAAADRILRKHGAKIIDKQLATRRLADIMIDLFVLACVLSRVNSAIEQSGAAAAGREIDILKVFAIQARERVKANFYEIDHNEDERLKALADHAFETERFGWDTI